MHVGCFQSEHQLSIRIVVMLCNNCTVKNVIWNLTDYTQSSKTMYTHSKVGRHTLTCNRHKIKVFWTEVPFSVERIKEICNPNPVQNFHCVIQSDPNPLLLPKYLIQSGFIKKALIKHLTDSDQCSLDICISSGSVFFKIQFDPVVNCRIRLDRDSETGSCSTLVPFCLFGIQ